MDVGMSSLDIERDIDDESAADIYDKYHEWSPVQGSRSPASSSLVQSVSSPVGERVKVILYKMEDGKVHYQIEKI